MAASMTAAERGHAPYISKQQSSFLGESSSELLAEHGKKSVFDTNAVRVLVSYVPASVVLHYAAQPQAHAPDGPEREDFPGAIGFIDVSGFTALSEKLAKDRGRGGAELLNQCALVPPLARGACTSAARSPRPARGARCA